MPFMAGWPAGSRPTPQAGDDHVLEQFEAVGAVATRGAKASAATEADHLIVGVVARVDDPVVVTEPADGSPRSRVPGRGRTAPRGSIACCRG